MTTTLYHGAHTRFALHLGQCWTPEVKSADAYADQSGEVQVAEVALGNLEIVDADNYDWDADEAPGDRGVDSLMGDIVRYADADVFGRAHTTYRIVSQRALDAFRAAECYEIDRDSID